MRNSTISTVYARISRWDGSNSSVKAISKSRVCDTAQRRAAVPPTAGRVIALCHTLTERRRFAPSFAMSADAPVIRNLPKDLSARATAGLISIFILAALIPPLARAVDMTGNVILAVWAAAKFFTIIANTLAGVGFGVIAIRGREGLSPRNVGALVLALSLVGVVANLILPPLPYQTVADMIGDRIHHLFGPLAVAVWWVAFAQHGRLRWRDAFAWALLPLAYSAYALTRASLELPDTPVRYPYFFMDVSRLGLATVIGNLLMIAIAFVAAGLLLVTLDRLLSKRLVTQSSTP